MTAFASGCSLLASNAYALASNASALIETSGTRSVTIGSPRVRVPVLSSATTCTFPAFSSETAVLNKIPFLAPTPLPTMIATGVASPSAHGQLITNTEIPRASANPTPFPRSNHIIVVTAAIAITMGTNTPETLSATLAIGAFVAAASLTILMICDNVVSSPTLVALQQR